MAFIRDNLERAGAERLSWQVKDYWQARGYRVETRVEVVYQFGEGIWVVRSDMVDGWPKERSK